MLTSLSKQGLRILIFMLLVYMFIGCTYYKSVSVDKGRVSIASVSAIPIYDISYRSELRDCNPVKKECKVVFEDAEREMRNEH